MNEPFGSKMPKFGWSPSLEIAQTLSRIVVRSSPWWTTACREWNNTTVRYCCLTHLPMRWNFFPSISPLKKKWDCSYASLSRTPYRKTVIKGSARWHFKMETYFQSSWTQVPTVSSTPRKQFNPLYRLRALGLLPLNLCTFAYSCRPDRTSVLCDLPSQYVLGSAKIGIPSKRIATSRFYWWSRL